MRRMDMVMLTVLNAQERTEAEFKELFRAASPNFVFKVREEKLHFPVFPRPGEISLCKPQCH